MDDPPRRTTSREDNEYYGFDVRRAYAGSIPRQATMTVPRMAGFVLVGGQSRRMGRDKALLKLDGQPLLLRAVELLRPYVCEIALLGSPSRYASFGLPVIPDFTSSSGPLAGLQSGLSVSRSAWSIFLACDLPLLEPRIIQAIACSTAGSGAQAIVPRIGGRWQPLCAAYHRSCLPWINQALDRRRLSVVELLTHLRVAALALDTPEEENFLNLNTPMEWRRTPRRRGGEIHEKS